MAAEASARALMPGRASRTLLAMRGRWRARRVAGEARREHDGGGGPLCRAGLRHVFALALLALGTVAGAAATSEPAPPTETAAPATPAVEESAPAAPAEPAAADLAPSAEPTAPAPLDVAPSAEAAPDPVAPGAPGQVAPGAPDQVAPGAPEAVAPVVPAAAGDTPLLPGPALREALAAGRAGDVDGAAARFSAIATQHPIVADWADLLRARAWLEVGRFEAALAAAREGEVRTPTSPLLPDLMRARGDAQVGLGDSTAAREAFETALARTQGSDRQAELRGRLATSFEAAGDVAAALPLWVELWRASPLTPDGRRAAERLDAEAAASGKDVRRPADYLARADVFFRAGYTEEALHDLDHARALPGLDAAEIKAAALQRAQCLFRLRRYADAESAFAALEPDDDAALMRARSAARGGDVPRGVALLDGLAERAKPRNAAQARWYAGLLLDGEGEIEAARERFAAVAAQKADPSLVPNALWRLGFAAYRLGDFAAARGYFEQLETAAPDAPTRLQARYWNARAAERAGQQDEANAGWAALARDFPLSYYGWRAAERAPAAGLPAAPPPVALGPPTLGADDLARPRILLEAGLDGAAAEETARLLRRAGGSGDAAPADRVELARLFAQAGDPNRAQGLIVDGLGDVLARGAPPSAEEPWLLAWPLAFPGPVEDAVAGKGDALRDLVYAIMREESGYRPAVVSPAGARGLLQIMPETGARLARQAGVDGFTADALFEPEVNVRLGAVYLEDLTRRFDGRLSAAIGSYNAGPEAVSRWLAERATLPDDEWVEAIPYDQTRGYVKRVLRSLHAYQVLYP